jgi:hypothetical protein
MENNLYDYETEPEKRQSFLTWLCILTFIGSGWAIVSDTGAYSTAHKTATMFSQNIKVQINDSTLENGVTIRGNHRPIGAKMKASISKIFKEDNIRETAIGGLVAALLTLAGALFMWKLKRTGFYLYIAGVVVGILVPFFVFGNDLIAVGASSFASFFGLIFIALYAVNWKSLK